MKIVEKEMVEVGARGGGSAAHPAGRSNIRTPDATAESIDRPDARGASADAAHTFGGGIGADADFQAAEALLVLGPHGLMTRPDGTALLLLPIT